MNIKQLIRHLSGMIGLRVSSGDNAPCRPTVTEPGFLSDTIVFEGDIISPIDEDWDACR